MQLSYGNVLHAVDSYIWKSIDSRGILPGIRFRLTFDHCETSASKFFAAGNARVCAQTISLTEIRWRLRIFYEVCEYSALVMDIHNVLLEATPTRCV